MSNGLDLLTADHQVVNELFAEIEISGDGAVIGQIVDALKAHDDAEHAVLYPTCARLISDDGLLARCEAAHSAVKRQIDLLVGLEGPPFVQAAQDLRVLVANHVEEEENKLFPKLSDAATALQLEALGARLLQAKQRGG